MTGSYFVKWRCIYLTHTPSPCREGEKAWNAVSLSTSGWDCVLLSEWQWFWKNYCGYRENLKRNGINVLKGQGEETNVEGERRKKNENLIFPLKMYNNLHSAQSGGINSSSSGKFPDRERKNRKEELPSSLSVSFTGQETQPVHLA